MRPRYHDAIERAALELTEIEPSADFHAQVMARLSPRRTHWPRFAAAAAAAAAVIALTAVLPRLGPGQSVPGRLQPDTVTAKTPSPPSAVSLAPIPAAKRPAPPA